MRFIWFTLVVVAVLVDGFGTGFFSALGLAEDAALDAESFLASFTGPEGPLGRSNSPAFSPLLSAEAMCLSNELSLVLPRSLLAFTYFLIAWRLQRSCQWKRLMLLDKIPNIPRPATILELYCGNTN